MHPRQRSAASSKQSSSFFTPDTPPFSNSGEGPFPPVTKEYTLPSGQNGQDKKENSPSFFQSIKKEGPFFDNMNCRLFILFLRIERRCLLVYFTNQILLQISDDRSLTRYDMRRCRMIYLLRKHDIISVPAYAEGIYHRTKCDIISKIYHPFRKERISLKKVTFVSRQK